MNSGPIGIFDSGVGGLTVVKEIISAMPNEDIVYFGDTARVPYGSKSKETVTKFACQITRFLLTKQVKIIVIACNTVSTNSYEPLKAEFALPIFEMARHGALQSIESFNIRSLGVIGTEATIRSGVYEDFITARYPKIKVYSKACPLFVPLAEEGWTDNDAAHSAAKLYLSELAGKIDGILLACTHYPLLENCIAEAANTTIINPAKAAAGYIKDFLSEKNMAAGNNVSSKYKFYVSDNTEKFGHISKNILGKSYPAEKVDIEKY